jgi:predicted MFS family arabinose efflux permease
VIAILNHDYPQGPARARAFSLFFALSFGIVGLAPLIGALLTEYGSWRWAFLVNAPLAAVVVVGVYRLTPAVPAAGSANSFNLLGSVLLVFAMGLILFAIQQGSRYGWLWSQEGIEFLGRPWTLSLSPTPVMLGVGAVLLTAFILVERWRAKRQLDVVLDMQLFRIPSYVWGTIGIALACSALICALLVVSLYGEYVLGASAIAAGLMVAPVGLGSLATAFISAWLARFSGKRVGVISIAVQLIVVVILITALSVKGFPFVIGAAMFFIGLSIAGVSAMTSLTLTDVPAELTGEAAGIQTSTRYLICGFAMVVMTTLLMSVTAYGIQKVSLAGLTASDRMVLDAVERLQRPAAPQVLAEATDPAQRKELEDYDQDLSTMRLAIDKGTRATGIVAALMLAMALVAATRLPRQPGQSPAS